MGSPTCTDDEFIALFKTHGPSGTAKILDIRTRGVHARRVRIEKRMGIALGIPDTDLAKRHVSPVRASQRLRETIENGVVLIGSDAHYWPGIVSTAHRGFVHFCKKYKPVMVIMNGDVMDGAKLSRFARIGWDDTPTVIDEIETCQERLDEIRKAAGKNCKLIWPLGNHDARLNTRLANLVPEFAHVHGSELRDHFPWWEPCWSIWLNDVVVKHRFKGGIHATHNNTLLSGRTMVTSHLHSLKVTPFSDYDETRWGVDTGTLMDPYPEQTADYTEDAPLNHRSGFIMLTFKDGRLLWPEIIWCREDGKIEFRGEIHTV